MTPMPANELSAVPGDTEIEGAANLDPLRQFSRHVSPRSNLLLVNAQGQLFRPEPGGVSVEFGYVPSSVISISRSLVHDLRSAISGWYSGEVYQALSASMLGNSIITTRSGNQWPPSGNLWLPPFVKYRPPCFAIIGKTATLYCSNLAASVILCSTTI